MATWVRAGTGTAPQSAPSGDLDATSGRYALDNATAPGDFDPDAVSSVRLQWTLTGSGFSDDTWTHNGARLLTGATELATVNDGTSGLQNAADSGDGTDPTIPTGQTTAAWEAAELGGAGIWASYSRTKGADGGVITASAVTVTITYTPAAAGPTYDETGRANTITATTAVVDQFDAIDTVRATTITATTTVTDTVPEPDHVLFDGTNDSVTGPDAAAYDIAGDGDVRVRVRFPTWTSGTDSWWNVVTRWGASGNAWGLQYDPFDGRIVSQLNLSTGSVTQNSQPFTKPADNAIVDLRFTFDTDGSAGNYLVTYYYRDVTSTVDTTALSSDTGWTSTGTRAGAAPATFVTGSSPITIGYNAAASQIHTAMHVFDFQFYSGLTSGGTRIANPYFQDGTQTSDGGATFVDDQTITWTLNDGAAWSGPASGAYNETLRANTITATTVLTDQLDAIDTALANSVTATTALSDAATLSELVQAISVTATTALSDTLAFNDLAMPVTITSTTTATDQKSMTDLASITITSTTTASNVTSFVDAIALSIISTITSADQLALNETTLATSIAGSTNLTDLASFTDSLATTITVVVDTTDLASFTDSMAISITATTIASDALGGGTVNYNETGRAITITATVASADQLGMTELVPLTASTTVLLADVLSAIDTLATTITSTTVAMNVQAMVETLLTNAITSTTTSLDAYAMTELSEIVSAVTLGLVDTAAFTDELALNIISFFGGSDTFDDGAPRSYYAKRLWRSDRSRPDRNER